MVKLDAGRNISGILQGSIQVIERAALIAAEAIVIPGSIELEGVQDIGDIGSEGSDGSFLGIMDYGITVQLEVISVGRGIRNLDFGIVPD